MTKKPMTDKIIHFTKVGNDRWNFFTPDFVIRGKIFKQHTSTGDQNIVSDVENGARINLPSILAAKKYAEELVNQYYSNPISKAKQNPIENEKSIYHTPSGKIAFEIKEFRPGKYSYSGKYGAGSGNLKHIYDVVTFAKQQHKGMKHVSGFNYLTGRSFPNPVPKGKKAAINQAKRRYTSFRDQPVTDTVEIKAPDYAKGAKAIGYCSAIDYTTFRGDENKLEKYRHDFKKECAPVIMRAASGHYWSSGGRYRFTYRGFLDNPKMIEPKAGIPPFPTALVVGYLDAFYVVKAGKEQKINFIGKKVLLCVSESGYNFFTVKES